MKKIFITGAAGFIGRHLLTSLVKNKNVFIKALDQNQVLLKNFCKTPNIELIIGDIRNYNNLEKLFAQDPPDVIVHLAAIINSHQQRDYFDINVEGTKNLICLAEIFRVKKFIFLSTDYVLYNLSDPYTQTKRACEKLLHLSNLNFTIFRPSPVFGLGDNKNFATLISVVKKYPILPAIKCQMEPVYVDDVVKMIITSFDIPFSRRIYNLPGGSIYDFSEILVIITRLLGLKRFIITLPKELFLPALKLYEFFIPHPLLKSYQVKKWLKNQALDASLAKKELNYNPLSFEEGMRRVLSDGIK